MQTTPSAKRRLGAILERQAIDRTRPWASFYHNTQTNPRPRESQLPYPKPYDGAPHPK